MFGLTVEKLVVIALLAAFVIGPSRLPAYAHTLATLVRRGRALVETAKAEAEEMAGVDLSAAQWERLDVRRYDPRRIVREALGDTGATPEPRTPEPPAAEPPAPGGTLAKTAPPIPSERPASVAARPAYRVTGSSGHPRRRIVPPDPEPPAASTPGAASSEPHDPSAPEPHGERAAHAAT